jgi:hypothetical protein
MNAKLTLRLDQKLIEEAKSEAARRGKSVSQMVADFFKSLACPPETDDRNIPPVTRSLYGILADSGQGEDDYKKHLEEKYR